MSWQPGDYHEPRTVRVARGWRAECPCGVVTRRVHSRGLAEFAALAHAFAASRECRCYDPRTMEYGPVCSCGRETVTR